MNGTIHSIELGKRYGFIRSKEVTHDIFFHEQGLLEPLKMSDLERGTEVTFDLEQSPKGPRAERVSLRDS